MNGQTGRLRLGMVDRRNRPAQRYEGEFKRCNANTCMPSEWGESFSSYFDAFSYDLRDNYRPHGQSGTPLVTLVDGNWQVIGVTIFHRDRFVAADLSHVTFTSPRTSSGGYTWAPPSSPTDDAQEHLVALLRRVALTDRVSSNDACWQHMRGALARLEEGSVSWAEEGMHEEFTRHRLPLSRILELEQQVSDALNAPPCSDSPNALRGALHDYALALAVERTAGAYRTVWSLSDPHTLNPPSYLASIAVDHIRLTPDRARDSVNRCRNPRSLRWTGFHFMQPEDDYVVSPTGARVSCFMILHDMQGAVRPWDRWLDDLEAAFATGDFIRLLRLRSEIEGALSDLDERPAQETSACQIMRGMRFAGFGRGDDPCAQDADPRRRAITEALWEAYRQDLNPPEVTWSARAERPDDQFWSAVRVLSKPDVAEVIDVVEWVDAERGWSSVRADGLPANGLRQTMDERLASLAQPPTACSAPMSGACSEFATVRARVDGLIQNVDRSNPGAILARMAYLAHVRQRLADPSVVRDQVVADFASRTEQPFLDPDIVDGEVEALFRASQLRVARSAEAVVQSLP
ncbi:MAG: hypothetical protein R3B82_18435 [Sandaracinaceae bacterium]